MIPKHIQWRGDDSFRRLAGYETRASNRGDDPVEWEMDVPAKATNCVSEDPCWAVKECIALGAQNTRSKRPKSYHMVISFPEGEKPTSVQFADIEKTLVSAIGLREHKRISAIHQDTDNCHLHIAICTVHPESLRNISPWHDHLKMQTAAGELELRHGLKRENHLKEKHAQEWQKHKDFHDWRWENLQKQKLIFPNRMRTAEELRVDRKEDRARLKATQAAEIDL